MFADMDSPSPVLVVAFGGLAMSIAGKPPFEFFRMLNLHSPTKKLFVRDHQRSWYHRGVRELAADIPGVAARLGEAIGGAGADKVVMLGTSAGGYAALLFGRLIGVSEVHAFAPQTFISPQLRERYEDHRFDAPLASLMRSGGYQSEFGDLDRVFDESPAPATRFVVHYCRRDPLDSVHAERLSPAPNLELKRYEEGGHNVVKHLRERGELQPLIREMIVT